MQRSISAKRELKETLRKMHLLTGSAAQEFCDFLALANEVAGTPTSFISFGLQDWQSLESAGDLSETELRVARSLACLLQTGHFQGADAAFQNLEISAQMCSELEGAPYAFAGMLLHAGYQCLGSLCVMDRTRRSFTEHQLQILSAVGRQLSTVLEGRWQVTMQTKLNARLSESLARASGTKVDAMIAASRLESLFHGLPIACFTFDVHRNVMEWNGSAEKLFGIPAHEAADRGIYELLSNSHVPDRARPLVAAVLNGDSVTDIEWTYRRNDRKRLRISSSAFPIYGRQHEIIGAVSTHVDLTQLREQELAVLASEHRLTAVIASMRDGVVLQDRDGRIMVANSSAERIFGLPSQKLEGLFSTDSPCRLVRSDGGVLADDEYPTNITLRTGEAVHDFVLGLQRTDGSQGWIELDVTPLFTQSSKAPSAMVCTFSDVTRRVEDEKIIREQLVSLNEYSLSMDVQQMVLEEANRRLEALATTDGLTGLLNHRTFQDALERELRLSMRTDAPLSLIFMDIDSFKRFNDQFGHQAGDEALCLVARLITQNVRETDIVARYGGEELVVLLPDTALEGAKMVAEKLRAALAEHEWDYPTVTASFGVTTRTTSVHNGQVLIEQADKALYYSKSTGKNRVTHYWDLSDKLTLERVIRTDCA